MKLKRHMAQAALLALLASGAIGCTTTQKGAGIGAAVGAGTGAIIGHNTKAGAGAGALIGGAVGGLGGALAGDALEEKREREDSDYRHRR